MIVGKPVVIAVAAVPIGAGNNIAAVSVQQVEVKLNRGVRTLLFRENTIFIYMNN